MIRHLAMGVKKYCKAYRELWMLDRVQACRAETFPHPHHPRHPHHHHQFPIVNKAPLPADLVYKYK